MASPVIFFLVEDFFGALEDSAVAVVLDEVGVSGIGAFFSSADVDDFLRFFFTDDGLAVRVWVGSWTTLEIVFPIIGSKEMGA